MIFNTVIAGGGGSMTTKSVTVAARNPMLGSLTSHIYYTDANGQVVDAGQQASVTVDAVVGTLLVVYADPPATQTAFTISGADVLQSYTSSSKIPAVWTCEVTA